MLNRKTLSWILVLAAVALLLPIYGAPVWWVSLEAPQYPAEAFPDGVRIQFHMNGVFSGCRPVENVEIAEGEALDCVHEMDTINHYVGMYPIASGGPVELFFSVFLLAMVGMMALGFLVGRARIRALVLTLGFAAIVAWMALAWYAPNGLRFHSARYLEGRITVLGENAEDEEELSAAEALIARLKASLEEDAGEDEEAVDAPTGKAQSIDYLADSFAAYQKRTPGEDEVWRGSGAQLLAWHYGMSLGRYFRDPEQLKPMVRKMSRAGNILFWGIVSLMALIVVASRRTGGLGHWLLGILPISLPLLFVAEYAAWLWWYGHNMNEMGAFTLKPFMPTVFGQGKVAQFTTNSYPDLGFWLMLLFALLLGAAVLLRWKEPRKEDGRSA